MSDSTSSFAGGKEEMVDFLALSEIRFTLDGSPLPVERTALKPVSLPLLEDAYGVNFGAFLPPGSLSLGAHEVQWTLTPGLEETHTPFSFTVISC